MNFIGWFSNDDLLTFAFRMIDHEGIVTKEKVENVLNNYNLDLSVRAEELPLEVFVDISNNL